MESVLRILLTLSAGGTVLGLFLLLLRRIFGRKLASTFYYYAWLIVFLRFVLPMPGLIGRELLQAEAENTVIIIYGDTGDTSPESTLIPFSDSGSAAEASRNAVPTRDMSISALSETENKAKSEYIPVSPDESPSAFSLGEFAFHLLRSARFWAALWLCGAVCSLLWYLAGYWRFSCILRRDLIMPTDAELQIYISIPQKNKPELAKSSGVDTPILLGLIHPLLVLPDREYSPERLKNIFNHELTHYRRGDLIFKWFAVLVFSLHWFNPFTRLFRRELDRACELSCDEHLLRSMDRDDRQNYGETLLDLAAEHSRSPSVIATSFAMEKRNLKERLEQIMTYKKKGKAGLALALAVILLLCGCGAVLGPAASSDAQPSSEPDDSTSFALNNIPDDAVSAESVDAFLAAIAPGASITLEEGSYDFSLASDYGEEKADGYYRWKPVSDGYELIITGVDGLRIQGQSRENSAICIQPRYANVLSFENCSDIRISSLTAGHTEAPVECSGGVLKFSSTNNVNIYSSSLYGCGTVGIQAESCSNITANNSDIFDCSYSAVFVKICSDVRLTNCRIYDCGGSTSLALFQAMDSRGFAVVNTEIYGNKAATLMSNAYSKEMYLLGCAVEDNSFSEALFRLNRYGIIVDQCGFTNNKYLNLCIADNAQAQLQSSDGAVLTEEALLAMAVETASYNGPVPLRTAVPEGITGADGTTEVHVNTVDEFLASIAPNSTIYLDGENFELSSASSYGFCHSDYYYWYREADGPGLVIRNVENLKIIGQGRDLTTLCNAPRMVNVLGFENCNNISVSDLTIGHTIEPGVCAGGVLKFSSCSTVTVDSCGLFGCGILGVDADNCSGMDVKNTEIYECSSGAARFDACNGIVFTGCSVRDCGTPEFVCTDSDITYNGAALPSGNSQVGA